MNTKQLMRPSGTGAAAWRRVCAIGAMTGICAVVASCGTGAGKMRPPSGQALIDSKPISKHKDRIKGMRIVSVNGGPASRRAALIASGVNTVKVRYDWPQGGSQEVNLKFNARGSQRYFVKYDPFPPTADQFRGTTELSNAAEGIGQGAYRMMEHPNPLRQVAGVVVLAPAIVLGTGNFAHRVGETIREHHEAVHYVDVMVISENNAEGVVRRVRAFPGGRIVSEPWDAYSSAPSGATPRDAVPPQNQRAGDGTPVFRRRAAEN